VEAGPSVGPGGLVNLSHSSRKVARAGREAKRSDLYGPTAPTRGPGSAKAADASRDPAPSKAAAAPAEARAAAAAAAPPPPPTPKRSDWEVAAAAALEGADLAGASPTAAAGRAASRARATRGERRAAALCVVGAHVFLAAKVGARVVPVAAAGGLATLYALSRHDDDAALARARGAVWALATPLLSALSAGGRVAAAVPAAAAARCPASLQRVALAAGGWRLAVFLAPRRAASTSRAAAALALAGVAAACSAAEGARLPRRGLPAALAGLVGAYAGTVALEAAAGEDATAFLLGAGWLTRPSVASLVARLESAGEVAPTVRARDFGVALVCASPRPGGDGGDRGRLYVGCLGTWLAVSGSAAALPAGKKGD